MKASVYKVMFSRAQEAPNGYWMTTKVAEIETISDQLTESEVIRIASRQLGINPLSLQVRFEDE